jgi:acetylornithine deacetylase/succinyl-diaminopimelate desuccinylase family protein
MNRRFATDPEAIFRTLADLVSINSVNPNYPGGPGEAAIADYICRFFRKNSIPFEVQTVFEGRPNVIAKLEGRPGGRTVILEAHMDTASELGMTADPFVPTRTGNRMYGRGSCDTKGGLAAMMHAVKALKDSEQPLRNSVLFAATADEEFAFRGVLKVLESGVKGDGAIVAEPTDLNTVVASKGVLRWRIRTRGKAAHSSKPHLGVNAITKMARLILAIEEKYHPALEKQQHALVGRPTLNVGVIQGGIQVNQVPDSCAIDLDRRMLPGETRQQVWQAFEDLIDELRLRDPGMEIEMESPMLESFPLETSPTERIVQAVTAASSEVIGPRELIGVPYGSDASRFSIAGIPSVILGPGSIDQAHAAEEYVDLDQVVGAVEIYARAILEF